MLDKDQIPQVALEEMNAVHQEEVDLLIGLLNGLDAVTAGRLAPDTLDAPLARLIEHMRAHFAGEEERMVGAGFPSYLALAHKEEHERALAEARSIYDAWLRERDGGALAAYLERALPAWMIHHISTMDAAAARFLAASGQEYRSVGELLSPPP